MRIKLQHPKHHDIDGNELPFLNTERFYFEIQADGNHATLATSEIYESREAAEAAIALIQHEADWDVVDLT